MFLVLFLTGLGGTGGGGLFTALGSVLISPFAFGSVGENCFKGGSSMYFGGSSSCSDKSGLAVPIDDALVP